jgi:hypothetical protein
VHVQGGARHPLEQRVSVPDEARQRRHSEALPHRVELRSGVRA